MVDGMLQGIYVMASTMEGGAGRLEYTVHNVY